MDNGYLTIKDLPISERPQERLLKFGAKALSDAELIALIIRTGSRSESALSLAQRLLKGDKGKNGLIFLVDASIEELTEIKGIGPVKSVQLKAVVELGRRMSSNTRRQGFTINSPGDVKDLLMEEMRFLEKEHFKAILLNIKNRVMTIEDISMGSLNTSIVHPREVFKPAIRRSSALIILAHNHPSGDPTPSKEDVEVTMRLIKAGKLLGIQVLDHVVIGDGCITSLKEIGAM